MKIQLTRGTIAVVWYRECEIQIQHRAFPLYNLFCELADDPGWSFF